MSTDKALWKKPGPKGQRESRVQSKDPTGRESRLDAKALGDALARFMRPAPRSAS